MASYSPVAVFQTSGTTCGHDFASTDVPKAISATSINTISSVINIPANSIIGDVDVNMAITHTYTGDIVAHLVSPSNDTIDLFDQPGVPATAFGCSGEDANLVFDSETTDAASMLEDLCGVTSPSLFGTFQSIESLASLNGETAQGTWTLLITDNFDEDGGALTAWGLSFCFSESVPAASLLANNPLIVPANGSGDITTALLELSTSDTTLLGQFIVTGLPAYGTLTLDGTALGIGGVFTQADINAGLLAYTNNGDPSTMDSFHFDALDANNNAWLHNGVFNIIVVQNNLTATATQTADVPCFNGTGAEITVNATGLDGMYMYSLNGGAPQSSNVFTGLAAGAYTVVVTGQFGFTVSASEIVIPDAVEVTVTASSAGQDVSVTASGGTGVYEYSINGVDFQASNTFVGLANGVYTVTVQDANGCTATTEVIVAFNTLIVTSSIQTAITCGGAASGEISVNVGGGQSPLSFSINGGAPQSSNVFTGLAAGTYIVVVTDNLGFTAETSPLVLDEPTPISVSASAALNVVTVTASGGTGTLEYSLNGGMFQSSNIFPALANGNYTVTVRDENGCTKTGMVTVEVPALTLTASITAILDCFGAANGSIEAAATGGIPPYEFKLNSGTYQSGNVFTGLAAGTYTVWVRDAFGTETMQVITLNQPTQVTATVTVVLNDGMLTISGGTPPYSYATDAPNVNLQNLPNGTYSLLVTDANGCTGTTTFTVDVPPLSWSSVISNVTCAGAGNGSITINAAGGIPPYQYSLNGGMFQSSNIFTGISAGAQTVVIRDSEGGQVSGTVTITAPMPVVLNATSTGSVITAVATGGTMPYQYSLNGGPLQSSGTFSGLNSGTTYTVMATDANGCTATLVVMTSAVLELAQAWGLTVSPNPGNGLFELTMHQAPAVLRGEVFDGAGRLLRSLDFAPNSGQFKTMLDLQDMPNGTYILRLTDGKHWGGVRLSKVE
jgi:subtilisin-like proprotein convertase family protein